MADVSNKGQDPAIRSGDDDSFGTDDTDQALRIVRFFFDNSNEGATLLSQASGCVGKDSNLPSWMPDVSGPKRARSGLNSTVFQTAVVEKPHEAFASNGGRKLSIACALVPCACDGHNLIAATTDVAKQDAAWLSALFQWRHVQGLWAAMRSPEGEPFTKYPDSDEPALEVIWETLRKGKQNDAIPARLHGSMASAKAIFMALVRDDMREVVTQHFESAKDAVDCLSDDLEGWKFCVMITGYMALVPEEAEVGDEILAVYGARVPFVLRPVQGTDEYRLVGECYVHGVMNGELRSKKMSFRTRVLV